MTHSVACVIPAYRAAATLAAVAAGLRRSLPGATLVAVDDGSRDETGAVARATCDRVLAFDRNQGKGAALRAGFDEALALGAEAVLSVDADGQHDPAEAPALVAALASADVALGVRRRGDEMPLARRLTNGLSAAAMSALAGTSLPDPQSGYRAFRRTVLERVEPLGVRYDYETDLLLRAATSGYRIASVPVRTIYGAGSHFRSLEDGALVVAAIWRHRGALWSRHRRSGVPLEQVGGTAAASGGPA